MIMRSLNSQARFGFVSQNFWTLDSDIGDQGDRICHEDRERNSAEKPFAWH
jgi:hypothetical protein